MPKQSQKKDPARDVAENRPLRHPFHIYLWWHNRRLFEEAGLDPNAPPAVREEVREVAAQLTDASKGQAGFMQLSLDNGGGWMFTAYYYSFSDKDLVEEQDGQWVATFNDETGVAVLQMLKDMRFSDNSLPERSLCLLAGVRGVARDFRQLSFSRLVDVDGGVETHARAVAISP
jgi:Bacterial extracellular solute-binding protein